MKVIFKKKIPDYGGRRMDVGTVAEIKDADARYFINRGFAEELIEGKSAAPQKKAKGEDPTPAPPSGSPAGSASARSSLPAARAPAPISSTTTPSRPPRRRAVAGSPASTKAGG